MTVDTSLPAYWSHMATLQVAENAPNLAEILADLEFGFRLVPAAASPPGLLWYQLWVDGRRGPRRCGLIAHRLLAALQRLADLGDLPAFRILAGERWLGYSTAIAADESSEWLATKDKRAPLEVPDPRQ